MCRHPNLCAEPNLCAKELEDVCSKNFRQLRRYSVAYPYTHFLLGAKQLKVVRNCLKLSSLQTGRTIGDHRRRARWAEDGRGAGLVEGEVLRRRGRLVRGGPPREARTTGCWRRK